MAEDERKKLKHPIQPIADDGQGVLRFKDNPIVRRLLDEGPFDMNQLAMWAHNDPSITADDERQFAQLIGYSLSGFGSLSYCDDETYEAAARMAQEDKSELEARVEYLEELVRMLRRELREPVAALFGVHPDDLMEE